MERLLLVDDDDPTRLIRRRFLPPRRWPAGACTSREARDGEEACRALDSAPFDCVLSDCRMGSSRASTCSPTRSTGSPARAASS